MTIKPASDPTFATNYLAAAGPDIGAPTRLVPTAPMRADGMYRDRRMPNRVFNSLVGSLGDWIKFFSDLQILNWVKQDVDFFAASFNNFGVAWVPQSAAGHDAFWLVFGTGTSVIAANVYPSGAVSGRGTTGTQPTLSTWTKTTSNADGSILVASGSQTGANTFVGVSTDRGATWVNHNVIVATNHAVASVVFDPVHSLFVLAVNAAYTTSPMYTSPDGVTWTQRVSPTGATGGSAPLSLVIGYGQVVVISSVAQLSVSSDGGVTWAACSATPVALSRGTWEATHGWTFTSSTAIYTTQNLAAFTLALTITGQINSIASDDASMSAAVVSFSSSTGVLYSTDGWLTNRFVAFDSQAAAASVRLPIQIKHNKVDQWAVLSCPSAGTIGSSTAFAFHTSVTL